MNIEKREANTDRRQRTIGKEPNRRESLRRQEDRYNHISYYIIVSICILALISIGVYSYKDFLLKFFNLL